MEQPGETVRPQGADPVTDTDAGGRDPAHEGPGAPSAGEGAGRLRDRDGEPLPEGEPPHLERSSPHANEPAPDDTATGPAG